MLLVYYMNEWFGGAWIFLGDQIYRLVAPWILWYRIFQNILRIHSETRMDSFGGWKQ
jgi:hypothetical protein